MVPTRYVYVFQEARRTCAEGVTNFCCWSWNRSPRLCPNRYFFILFLPLRVSALWCRKQSFGQFLWGLRCLQLLLNTHSSGCRWMEVNSYEELPAYSALSCPYQNFGGSLVPYWPAAWNSEHKEYVLLAAFQGVLTWYCCCHPGNALLNKLIFSANFY